MSKNKHHTLIQLSEVEQDTIASTWRSFGVVCGAIARKMRSLNNLKTCL
ncbi:MAG: hypothetical protein V7K27_17800 [Nostoc sp.]